MKRGLAVGVLCATLFAACGNSKKLATANSQIASLNDQLASATAKQKAQEQAIAELQQANEINSRDAADCRSAKEALRQKKEKINQELAARGTSIEELRAKATAAVDKLEAAGCEVTYEGGRFHIVVPDEFSNQSGVSAVTPKAREALNTIAQIMYDNPGVSAVIVGHTDNVPVSKGSDNWALSAARANAVVRVLQDLYNINPKRLTAAGSGEYHPRASNETAEGRRSNRRIEIFINPHLERIWNLVED